jgi:hypothetical protein
LSAAAGGCSGQIALSARPGGSAATGALHQMMARLSEPEREEAWAEIEHELSQFETEHGFEGPCEMIVSAGTAP